MKRMRGTACIIINDGDRSIDFVLEVPYEAHQAVPSRHSSYGWSEPEPAGVEIDGVIRCTEIVTWCGDYGYSSRPGLEYQDGGEAMVGEWCLEKYRDQIQEAVEREAAKAADDELADRDDDNDDRRETRRKLA